MCILALPCPLLSSISILPPPDSTYKYLSLSPSLSSLLTHTLTQLHGLSKKKQMPSFLGILCMEFHLAAHALTANRPVLGLCCCPSLSAYTKLYQQLLSMKSAGTSYLESVTGLGTCWSPAAESYRKRWGCHNHACLEIKLL